MPLEPALSNEDCSCIRNLNHFSTFDLIRSDTAIHLGNFFCSDRNRLRLEIKLLLLHLRRNSEILEKNSGIL